MAHIHPGVWVLSQHPPSLCFGDPLGPQHLSATQAEGRRQHAGSDTWRRMSQAWTASVSLLVPAFPRASPYLQRNCCSSSSTRAEPSQPLPQELSSLICGAGQGLNPSPCTNRPQLSAGQGRPFKNASKTPSKCCSTGAQRYMAAHPD